MTQNHFYYGNADMERYLARINAHDGKRTDSPILHFESFFDMELIKEVMQDCPDEFKSLNKNLEYRYTKTKKRAIRNHSQALEMGHDISTLVDMDHDIKSKDFRKKKRFFGKNSENSHHQTCLYLAHHDIYTEWRS